MWAEKGGYCCRGGRQYGGKRKAWKGVNVKRGCLGGDKGVGKKGVTTKIQGGHSTERTGDGDRQRGKNRVEVKNMFNDMGGRQGYGLGAGWGRWGQEKRK